MNKVKNEYHLQADNFLKKYCVDFKATYAVPQQRPLWAKAGDKVGICWSIDLIPQNKNKEPINFLFWSSIFEREQDEEKRWHISEEKRYTKPVAYDVLASLYPFDTDDGYEYFCDSLGFNQDSITARKTFDLSEELNNKLKSIFSKEALEELAEIN